MAIRSIFFPVNFWESSHAMAPTVKRVAAIASAKVTLRHVLQEFSSGFELHVSPLPEVKKAAKIWRVRALPHSWKLSFRRTKIQDPCSQVMLRH